MAEFKKLTNQIYLIEADTQYELCMTFIRLQEYYESPFEDIRGKNFTLEDYMDRYAKENGNFTYCEDWNGFNVPGEVVRKFFSTKHTEFMRNGASWKEKWLFTQLIDNNILRNEEEFYLLGTHKEEKEEDVLAHEYAHAFYHLDEKYRQAQNEWLDCLPEKQKKQIRKALKEEGYDKSVYWDEAQAYISTSHRSDLEDIFESEKWPPLVVHIEESICENYKIKRRMIDPDWSLPNRKIECPHTKT